MSATNASHGNSESNVRHVDPTLPQRSSQVCGGGDGFAAAGINRDTRSGRSSERVLHALVRRSLLTRVAAPMALLTGQLAALRPFCCVALRMSALPPGGRPHGLLHMQPPSMGSVRPFLPPRTNFALWPHGGRNQPPTSTEPRRQGARSTITSRSSRGSNALSSTVEECRTTNASV